MSTEEALYTDAFGNPVVCIKKFNRLLAGYSHPNKRGVDRLPLIRRLTKGTKLVLVPEPDNAYDRNAILVYRANDLDNDVGYLDSTGAKMICPLIERGATFSAEVLYVWFEKPNVPVVGILIFQSTPTLRKARPVHIGAPVYKHETYRQQLPDRALRNELTEASQNTIQLQEVRSEGFLSYLKHLLFG